MSTERDELGKLLFTLPVSDRAADTAPEILDKCDASADAILAAGYRKPRTITTTEELDRLPVGAVVLSEKYLSHSDQWRVSFQRWHDGTWHRGARSGDTHPDNFLPATVLHEGGGA